MDNGKKNALLQIVAVVNNRYNSLKIGDTRSKLFNLLSLKSSSTNYSGASKDIERIVLINVKEQGHETMLNMIDDIKNMSSNYEDSLVILNEISEYDQSEVIKKKLKSFKFNKRAIVQIPHEIKVLFDAEKITVDDIQKYESEIKASCNLSDDFFIKAVQSDSKFENYGEFLTNQHQTQQTIGIYQTQQYFNPYQNLSSNQQYLTILPPVQDPSNIPYQNQINSPDKIPVVSPTQIPFVPNQNENQILPHYYLNPPYQPPPAPPSSF